MTIEELKEAVLALSPEEKKAFVLETLPQMAKDAMDDPTFLMQLFPIFLGILKEKNIDLQQLMQLATMMGGAPQQNG